MRIILISIAISILGLKAVAQNNFSYNKLINIAELCIVDSLYDEALKNYRVAFQLKEMASATDYFNAAVCAVLIGKEGKALSYLEELKKKGVALRVIQESPVLNSLGRIKKWQNLVSNYEASQQKWLQKLDKVYRDSLIAMVARDQVYARKRQEYILRGTDESLIKAYDDTLRMVVNENTDAFLKLISQRGFPSETRVGDIEAYATTFYDVLLRHALQYQRRDILPILLEAVKKGDLSPHQYAYHAEFESADTYGTTVLVFFGGKEESQIDPKAQQEIDKKRLSLGMENLAELLRKAKFHLNDKRFHINKVNSIVRFG